jgi:hypothetical protein
VPTRKQRRKRQKERRHEYEFVYVDSEGHEVEDDSDVVEAKPRPDERRNGKRGGQKPKGGGKPLRKVDPPSWSRTARRAAIFAPLIFVAFTFLNGSQSIATRLLLTLLYTAFFVPFMYLMDRTMYRTYLRRSGQSPPPSSGRRR